jgi:hypothetical protein
VISRGEDLISRSPLLWNRNPVSHRSMKHSKLIFLQCLTRGPECSTGHDFGPAFLSWSF